MHELKRNEPAKELPAAWMASGERPAGTTEFGEAIFMQHFDRSTDGLRVYVTDYPEQDGGVLRQVIVSPPEGTASPTPQQLALALELFCIDGLPVEMQRNTRNARIVKYAQRIAVSASSAAAN